MNRAQIERDTEIRVRTEIASQLVARARVVEPRPEASPVERAVFRGASDAYMIAAGVAAGIMRVETADPMATNPRH